MNNNPNNLQIGKTYLFKYCHSANSVWEKGTCTRITDLGHPWVDFGINGGAGVITPGSFDIKEFDNNQELHMCAQQFLKNNDFSDKRLSDILCEFYLSLPNKFKTQV